MRNKQKQSCVILMPVASTIEPDTETLLQILGSRGYEVRLLRGCSEISLARSIMATNAFRDGWEETLWIDSDITFRANRNSDVALVADDVDKIRAHNLPICAGLYLKKKRQEFAGKFFAGTKNFSLGKEGGLLEMELVGMGFTHVRREVYDAIAETLPECGGGYNPAETIIPFFLPLIFQHDGGHDFFSEDYSFCQRAREAGFKIHADTTIKLGHIGKYTYTWDDLAQKSVFESIRLDLNAAPTDQPSANEELPVSAALYEKLGRKQEQLEQLDANYSGLLTLLAAVVSGAIEPSRILVNLTDRQWIVSEKGTSPAMPATINGLPQCVTAPVPPIINEEAA